MTPHPSNTWAGDGGGEIRRSSIHMLCSFRLISTVGLQSLNWFWNSLLSVHYFCNFNLCMSNVELFYFCDSPPKGEIKGVIFMRLCEISNSSNASWWIGPRIGWSVLLIWSSLLLYSCPSHFCPFSVVFAFLHNPLFFYLISSTILPCAVVENHTRAWILHCR